MSESNDKPCVVFSDERCCQTCLFWMKPPVDYRPGACAYRHGRVFNRMSGGVDYFEAHYGDDCRDCWTDDVEMMRRCL